MRRIDPALVVVLAGISAALHVGKLPPALPVLREALGISLVEAGFLLSLVQLAGMLFGAVAGLAADSMGLRRTMVAGLALLSLASLWGGLAQDAPSLLTLRGLEGMGFLLASMPAPGLLRRLVPPARLPAMLGLWGAYMPFGTAAALLLGPLAIERVGWQGWWWLMAFASGAAACWLLASVPPDARTAATGNWGHRLRRTVSSRGPWLVALAFAVYSAQWLSVIGFLPSIYAGAGWSGGWASAATALAAAVNMVGNIVSGRLLQRGVPPRQLLYGGFAAMGLGALLAFADWGTGPGHAPALRYWAVLMFSMIGGVIPGTLFSLAVRLAPDEGTVSTTVGWMQQWSALGQFAGPPVVAWVAATAGGWQLTWIVTGSCALAGAALAHAIGRMNRPPPTPAAR